MSGMTINLPNQVTLSRLVLAIVLFVLMSFDNTVALNAALGVFIVAGLSDLLDGYLARKLKMTTEFGRAADPLVDKLVVLGALVYLLPHRQYSYVAPWMVMVVLTRELLVTGIRAVAESKGMPFAADSVGKIKTLLQSVAIGVALLGVANKLDLGWPLYAVLLLAVIMTAVSGVEYVARAYQLFAVGEHM